MDSGKKIFLYKQVYQDLKDKIESGDYQSGDLLPSEREVGDLYHVDRTTVRKAFALLVESGLVEKRAGKGSVVISRSPAGASTDTPLPGASSTIAFLLPKSTNKSDRITVPFYAELFFNIEKSCKALGYSLLYSSLDSYEDFEQFLVLHRNISGIIFVSNTAEACIERALNENIPCVLLNSFSPSLPSILSDNFYGTYNAARYLISHGHRDIAVLSGISDYVTAKERLQGVVAAFRESGLTLKDEYFLNAGTWEADGGFMQVKAMLSDCKKRPTAMICFNDRLASGAIQAVTQAGLSVPEDISIFGYDNSDHAKYSIPKMSSVEINTALMAKSAFISLLDQLTFKELLPIKIVTPVKLIERESVKTI